MSNLDSKRIKILFLILFAFALLVRTIYFLEFRENPYFKFVHPSHDSINMHNGAMEICNGDILLEKKGFKYPFYSYFVAVIYSLTDYRIYAVWIVQFILGALASVLIYLIGMKLFNRRVGVIASLFYALYGPNLFYEGIMLRAALTEFLALLSFYFLLNLERKISFRNLLFSGMSLSMMIECRANTVIVLPLVFIYIYFSILRKEGLKRRLTYVSIFILAWIVIGAPLLLRGICVEKRFQFYDPSGPRVLLLGNLVDYDGLGYHDGSPRYRDFLKINGNQVLYDYKWVLKKILKEIIDHPLEFIRLYLRKTYYFLFNYEIPANNNFYIHQRFSYLLKNPLSNFSLVVSLAFLGLIVTFKRYRENMLLYVFLLGMTGSALVFCTASRYRMPCVPFYLLFSSAGIYALYQFIIDKHFVRFFLAIALVSGSLFCLKVPDIQKIRANDYGMLGDVYLHRGLYDQAISEFNKALTIRPNAVRLTNLGIALAKQGRTAEAINHYSEALRINSDDADVHNNLGNALVAQGRLDEAINHYSEALRINSDDAGVHNNLGNALVAQGRLDEAVNHYSEALRISPDNAGVHNNLKRVLATRGKIDEAIAIFQQALKLNPEDPALHYKLGNLHKRKGELNKAIDQYQKALSIQPTLTLALNNLAMVYTIKKEYDQAISVFKKMIVLRPDSAGAPYNIACIYAKQNKVEDSIDWLKKAIDSGYRNWDLIKTDKKLENIRGSSYYKKIIRGD